MLRKDIEEKFPFLSVVTYGGNELITKTTGKSAAENLKEALTLKEEDTKFEILVKKNKTK